VADVRLEAPGLDRVDAADAIPQAVAVPVQQRAAGGFNLAGENGPRNVSGEDHPSTF
jgi:hypothetical protein